MLRNKRKGYVKKQVEKEGVNYEPGGFSTRFVFFLLFFVAHLSSLKLCFFSSDLVRHQKHHISVVILHHPQHTYRKLGVASA